VTRPCLVLTPLTSMRASRALLSASLVAQHASALHTFQEVWNFRKLRMLIYRSAALEKATPQDVDALLTKFRIRTIIDLRGEDERVKVAGSWVDTTFPKDDSAQTPRRLHHVPLLQTERHYRGIYERWPAWKQAQVAATSLVSGRAESQMYIDEINAGGLPLFSEVLLSKGGEDICKVLKLMATPGELNVLYSYAPMLASLQLTIMLAATAAALLHCNRQLPNHCALRERQRSDRLSSSISTVSAW
jgi:Tyrosine phosphatase family